MQRLVITAALLAPLAAAGGVEAPKGKAPKIDGSVGDAEWRDARLLAKVGDKRLRVKQDDKHLYVAVETGRRAIVTLFLQGAGETVHVLHSSARLGSVVYRRAAERKPGSDGNPRSKDGKPPSEAGKVWTRKRDFVYADPSSAYLHEHGWSGSVAASGTPGQVEFVVSKKLLGSTEKKALERLHLSVNVAMGDTWHWPASLKDGTNNASLCFGRSPERISFTPDLWTTITLEPKPKDGGEKPSGPKKTQGHR